MKKTAQPTAHGIAIKKAYGQHFLRDATVLTAICNAASLDTTSSVFEIGCGDGALTRAILAHPIARLWVFEIDPEWAQYVRTQVPDPRLTIFEDNILQLPLGERLAPHAPWTLIANLPYNITFPILRMVHAHRSLIREAVVMVQREVAHKLLKTHGRDYGSPSLFYQHYFQIETIGTIPPQAFYPPPSVHSTVLRLVPRTAQPIPEEAHFWKFIGTCFAQPRRTLRNNLAGTPYAALIEGSQFPLRRAQEMRMAEFLELWQQHLTQLALRAPAEPVHR